MADHVGRHGRDDRQIDKGMTRRGFLAGSSAAVAATLTACRQPAAGGEADAQPAASMPMGRVIDVHQHFWPDSYQKLAASLGGAREEWTPAAALDRMAEAGLGTAMLSMSNWVNGAKEPTPSQLVTLCRECNEYGARLVADYPTQFGWFASLMMLPDVDAALKEIEYAFDTLKADGIGLMTHYAQGTYLGDPALDPIFDELNRRQVVAFVHPSSPWYEFRSEPEKNPVRMPNPAALDLAFDTTRAMTNMLERDVPSRYPDIKFIWPHSGGGTIFLLTRAAVLRRRSVGLQQERGASFEDTYDGLAKTMATFYYDLALTTNSATIAALQRIAPTSHLLFGSDIPRAGHYTRDFLELLPKTGLAPEDLPAIARGNAEALFPRLSAPTT